LQLKETVNTTVDQLSVFASEVTRVAREVGTEGLIVPTSVMPASGWAGSVLIALGRFRSFAFGQAGALVLGRQSGRPGE
jgi:hypothetical protein